MKILLLLLAILLSCSVSSMQISLSCPNEVNVEQEFNCDISVEDGVGSYDVKFEIREGTTTVAKAFYDGAWKSTYYYINSLLTDKNEATVQLMITKAGEFDSLVKVRQGNKIENKSFIISVLETYTEESKTDKQTQESTVTQDSGSKKSSSSSSSSDDGESSIKKLKKETVKIDSSLNSNEEITKPQIISLNSNVVSTPKTDKIESNFKRDLNLNYYSIGALSLILVFCGIYVLKKL